MDENKADMLSRGCVNQGRSFDSASSLAYKSGCCKLHAFNYFENLPQADYTDKNELNIVEVRFKNSRKDIFRCPDNLTLFPGDVVAVESNPGHDLGVVSLTGEVARKQMRAKYSKIKPDEIKKLYRKARNQDIEKWMSAISLEDSTLFKSRRIISEMNLNMKLNDLEYQGDRTKATFFYTAEERVDFRELIKRLAESFQVRIEMRQIGARQEASRLGGIGSCGRELCCSNWLTDFSSVTTVSARLQQLPLNPQKLAGQCCKLKCCLNYEVDHYADALKYFPSPELKLHTKNGVAICQKSDIFKSLVWYSYESEPLNLFALSLEKVNTIIEMNRNGKKPASLEEFAQKLEKNVVFESVVGQDDLKRFDNDRK